MQLGRRFIRSAECGSLEMIVFPGPQPRRVCLKKFGLDGVLAQPFPNLMIFSKERRFEVRENHLAERHIRSVKSATDGGFQITESLGKRSLLFSKKQFFTLKVIDPTTIEITEAKVSTQLFKCSSNSRSL